MNDRLTRFYWFSVDRKSLSRHPWTSGSICILERSGFHRTHFPALGVRDEWISPLASTPIARISVEPEDFPFLGRTAAHDDRESVITSMLLYRRRIVRRGRTNSGT